MVKVHFLSALADFLLPILAIALWIALNTPIPALNARFTHDGANANAKRSALSDSLELEDATGHWGYSVFARRDGLAQDRNLINALVLVSAGTHLSGHSFYLGAGAHYRQQKLNARAAEPGDFLPALGFTWSHTAFRSETAASEKLTRSALSFLITAAVPIELNTEFEYLYSQPYRWSANIFAFLSRYGGLILGYEPLSVRARAGFWLKPLENLQLRSLARLNFSAETYWEFSLSYSFSPILTASEPNLKIETKAASPKPAQKKSTLQKTPAFATLVKWGLTPVEALKLTREKNICNLNAASQAALARHHWECRNEN